jgi:K+-transporting ATPase ATPase C chain
MFQHLRACLFLTVVSVVLCCIAYPLVLLGAGKLLFPRQAEGSLIERGDKVVGSTLIAQPFSDDKFFQPRPSAASYNGAASGASNWAASNYSLRDRVAQQLGPIVKYAGPLDKKDKPVGPDIEAWFQKDQLGGKPGIVEQWASLHNTSAQNWLHDWVAANKLQAAYVTAWEEMNPDVVKKWKDDNSTPEPKPEDLAKGIAVPYFVDFSKQHPGTLPGVVEYEKDGKTVKSIGPVKEGSDIQKLFFDLWLSEHTDVELQKVPADAVMASGSGLDPHITLDNAMWQLENQPIASAWAKVAVGEKATSADESKIRDEIKQLLKEKSFAPLGGLVGGPLVNVLEVNLALQDRYQKAANAK